ncbi:YhdP family protein [Pseudaeromonas pectinilytica]
MLRRTLFHTWRLAALLLLLLALLVSGARFGVPWLQAQRQALLDWLVADPALSSQVASLGARWTDFGPAITLQGLELRQKRDEPWQLTVAEATLQLDLWQSLSQQQWVIGELQFQGVEMILPRRLLSAQGESASSAHDWQPLSRLLLGGLKQFELRDSHLVVRSSLGDLGSLNISRLRWQNQGTRHRGDGELVFQHNGLTHQIRLIADFRGPADTPAALNGQLYLASNSQRQVAAGGDAQHANLSGQLGFEFWLERQANDWQLGLLKLADNQLQWQQGNRRHQIGLRGGLVQWQRLGQGWQLASHDLQVQGDGADWGPWRMQLDSQAGILSGRIDPVSLPAITPVLALLAGERSVAGEALSSMKPTGTLQQLAFERREQDGEWQLSGHLQALGWQRWEMVPGLRDVNGAFTLDAQGGRVDVQLGAQSVQVGPYFPADIPLTSLNGQLQWQQTAEGWQVSGQQLHLVTPALQADTDFRLELPHSATPYLALLTQVDLDDASQAWRYYPRLAMGQGLTDYLRAALQGGKAQGATVLWDGPLAEFPYHQGSGIFQAWVPLRHTTFQFDPAWLPLKEMSLDLLFQNDTLEMRSNAARLGDARTDHIHAWFPTLEPHSRLHINADIQGEAKAVSAYLQQSGVKDSVGAALQQLQLSKPLTGDLQLVIPVDGDPVQVLGHVQFAGNALKVVPLELALTQLDGELFFTEAETRFNGLQAELWGQPMRIDYQGALQDTSYQVQLGVQGRWSQARAQGLSAGWQRTFKGQTQWQGSVALQLHPDSRYDYQAQWQSDLKGLALTWPAPYTKSANQSLPLRVTARGSQSASTLRADWQNGLQFVGQLDHLKHQFSRFWISNQSTLDTLTPPAPVSLDLKFEQLDADAWQAWWQQLGQPVDGATLNHAGSWLPPTQSAQVQGQQLTLASQPWDKFSLQMTRDEQGVQGNVLANQLSGEVRWRPEQPLSVELAYLHWRNPDYNPDESASNAEEKTAQKEEPSEVIPPIPSLAEQRSQMALWPDLDFHCQRCQLDHALLGDVRVEGRRAPDAYLLPAFSLKNGGHSVQGRGSWRLKPPAGQSDLHLTLKASSLEQMTKDWNYGAGFGGTPATAELDVSWQGPVSQPHKPSMNGSFKLETGEGLLRKLDSTSTRLLSMLSLNSLMRRLSLDFGDAFEKGFFFKSITATGSIRQGVVHNEDFALLGDAGDIAGRGKLDLVGKKLDYQFTFTPHFTNGVSLATAFAVTPVTGIYVLAASTLLSPVIDGITRISFHLEGPLASPQVTEIGREHGQLQSIPADYRKALSR